MSRVYRQVGDAVSCSADHLQNALTRAICCHLFHHGELYDLLSQVSDLLLNVHRTPLVSNSNPSPYLVFVRSTGGCRFRGPNLYYANSHVRTCVFAIGGIRLRNRWFQGPCFYQCSVIKLR
ncbi:hypothetical protein BDR05DRAFT_694350 [Suillus weaverae]|nr:hypothetical protein BDR05DRAFT_694350 [Suillus weaverae]